MTKALSSLGQEFSVPAYVLSHLFDLQKETVSKHAHMFYVHNSNNEIQIFRVQCFKVILYRIVPWSVHNHIYRVLIHYYLFRGISYYLEEGQLWYCAISILNLKCLFA